MTMDLNTFTAVVLIAYGLYLSWCRYLEYRTKVADNNKSDGAYRAVERS